MELVYLWVEEYKNIREQGFNFSPRFECDYDGKELSIIEKKDDEYIKDFFGENINVTAIVGKNGSGKSSVLDFIKNIENENNKFCLIFNIKDDFFLSHSISNLEYDEKILQEINIEDIDSYFSIFSYSSELNQKNIINELITDLMKEDENDILEKFKHIFYPQKMKVSEKINYKEELAQKLLNTFDGNEPTYNLNTKITESINKNKNKSLITLMCENIDDGESLYDNAEEELIKRIIADLGGLEKARKKIGLDKGAKIEDVSEWISEFELETNTGYKTRDIWIKEEEYISSKKIYEQLYKEIYFTLYDFVSPRRKKSFQINIFQLFLFNEIVESKCINSYLDSRIMNVLENDNYSKITTFIEEDILDVSTMESFLEKKKINFKKENYNYKEFQTYLIKFENLNKEKVLNVFNKYSKFLSFDFIDSRYINERYFSNLSHGEKTFYSQFISIFHKIYSSKSKKHLLLFDEPDLSLHPEWQRQYFDEFIKVIKKLDENIKLHFFVTSHSPFLLSDIPKQNIIFLDKEEKGNCKVVDGLKEKKQTFGANIHTLLSDSFFMEDGLMGEFAKGKINKIIKNLQNDEYKPNEQEKNQLLLIIESIGEPFLRSKMLDMYNRKFIDNYKDREKKKIEEQINDLNKKLEELGNDSDR